MKPRSPDPASTSLQIDPLRSSPPLTQETRYKKRAYFVEETEFVDNVENRGFVVDQDDEDGDNSLQPRGPQAAYVERRRDYGISVALSPPNRADARSEYEKSELLVDEDGVSISEFSFSARDDHGPLHSGRSPVPQDDRQSPTLSCQDPQASGITRIDGNRVQDWVEPRRDAAMEALNSAHVANWESTYGNGHEVEQKSLGLASQQRPRILSDPGAMGMKSHWGRHAPVDQDQYRYQQLASGSYTQTSSPISPSQQQYQYHDRGIYQPQDRPSSQSRNSSDPGPPNISNRANHHQQHRPQSQNTPLPPSYQQQHYHQEQEPQRLYPRQRVFSDPGSSTLTHWEQRRDLMLGRASMFAAPDRRFDDDESTTSSFRILNVQRVPVGSLEIEKPPSPIESRKKRAWRRLKRFVS